MLHSRQAPHSHRCASIAIGLVHLPHRLEAPRFLASLSDERANIPGETTPLRDRASRAHEFRHFVLCIEAHFTEHEPPGAECIAALFIVARVRGAANGEAERPRERAVVPEVNVLPVERDTLRDHVWFRFAAGAGHTIPSSCVIVSALPSRSMSFGDACSQQLHALQKRFCSLSAPLQRLSNASLAAAGHSC